MTLGWLELVLGILATWRVTSLFVYEEGPWELFEKLRYKTGVYFLNPDTEQPETMLGKLLSCFWCTSIWVAALVGLILTQSWTIIVVVPSLSAGAILIDTLIEASNG